MVAAGVVVAGSDFVVVAGDVVAGTLVDEDEVALEDERESFL